MEETRENRGRAVGEDGRITALCQSLQPRNNKGAKMSTKTLLLRATETQRGRAEMEEKDGGVTQWGNGRGGSRLCLSVSSSQTLLKQSSNEEVIYHYISGDFDTS